MAVPKKRKSHSRTRMHMSHLALKNTNIITGETGEYQRPHHISAGRYNGRQVIVEKADEEEAPLSE